MEDLYNIDDIFEKYSKSVIENIEINNLKKIVEFLKQEQCDFIEDIIEDYLDVFTINYYDFQKKYQKLNDKYNNNYLNLAKADMNYLEELFYD